MRVSIALLAMLAIAPACFAGLYKEISLDGDFSDWASIPAVDIDAADNVGGVDFAVTKIANDGNFLYIYNSFHTAKSMPANIAIDTDNNLSTGFNIFGMGLVGADAGWENDYPFTSGDDVYNNGAGMSGGLYGIGAAAITPFSATASERELAISLDLLFNEDGTPVFGAGEFKILMWTSDMAGDVSAPISYSLASIPEPSALIFGAAIVVGKSLSGRRRSGLRNVQATLV